MAADQKEQYAVVIRWANAYGRGDEGYHVHIEYFDNKSNALACYQRALVWQEYPALRSMMDTLMPPKWNQGMCSRAREVYPSLFSPDSYLLHDPVETDVNDPPLKRVVSAA